MNLPTTFDDRRFWQQQWGFVIAQRYRARRGQVIQHIPVFVGATS